MKKTIQDQIKDLENTRAAKMARLNEIAQKTIEEERSMDEAESDESDQLTGEVEQIDGDLKRLAKLAALNVSKAAVLKTEDGQKEDKSSKSRGTPHVVPIERKREPGTGFARFAGCIAASKGSISDGIMLAKERFKDDTMLHKALELYGRMGADSFAKAAVDIGTTADSDYANPLVYATNLAQEFIEFLRPQTIIGQIPGLRKVPFNVRVPRQTGGSTSNWVGEGAPKPLSQIALDSVTMTFMKNAVIAVITEELARFSSPDAELLIRNDLANAIIQGVDADFIDPDNAGTALIKPASVTYGVTPVVANGGTSEANIRSDVNAILAEFITNNKGARRGVWVMPEIVAMRLSNMVTSLGAAAFPGISASGGTFFGLPVVTSQSDGLLNSSANGKIVALINAPEILLADDGRVAIDVSREASVQMDSAPTNPVVAATVLISLWQQNLLGIKAERFITWTKARSTSVSWINSVNWGE